MAMRQFGSVTVARQNLYAGGIHQLIYLHAISDGPPRPSQTVPLPKQKYIVHSHRSQAVEMTVVRVVVPESQCCDLVVVNLGWIDFDFKVPPSCPARLILPNSHLPRQNWAVGFFLENRRSGASVPKTNGALTFVKHKAAHTTFGSVQVL